MRQRAAKVQSSCKSLQKKEHSAEMIGFGFWRKEIFLESGLACQWRANCDQVSCTAADRLNGGDEGMLDA
jgi:hypothetical protein